MSSWPKPCVNVFREMALSHPAELSKWIASGELRPENLTFAVEFLGFFGGMAFLPQLLELLKHPSPLVREGVLLGFRKHHFTLQVLERVRELAELDPSPGVRSVAKEVLDELG